MPHFRYDTEVIERIREAAGVSSKAAIARALKMKPEMLNTYRVRGQLPMKHIIRFALETRTSLDWLLTGSEHPYTLGSPTVRAVREAEAEHGERLARILGAVRSILDSGDETVISALEHNLLAFLQAIRAQPAAPKQARRRRAQGK